MTPLEAWFNAQGSGIKMFKKMRGNEATATRVKGQQEIFMYG